MIKYLRARITGRPADDLSLDHNMPQIKKTHSQNSLNDVISISTNLNSNDITNSDRTTSQVEKLNATGDGINSGRRPICPSSSSSSSPIIIPKKLPRSNASSQSSSSHTSVVDQMSSLGDTSLQSHRDSDDVSNTSLPTLPFTCQQLKHSAARDRILVKNKCRQPIKQKLSTLKEIDDNQNDLFSPITDDNDNDDEQALVSPQIESKVQQQPIVDHSNWDKVRARLHTNVRPSDHSNDNVLPITTIVPTYVSSIKRTPSFERSQENNETKLIHRTMVKIKEEEENKNKNELISKDINVNESSLTQSIPHSSTQEHIYDNLGFFKCHQTNMKSNTLSNENESSTNIIIKTKEQSTSTIAHLKSGTMPISTNNDKQTVNDQAKKVPPEEEIIPEPHSVEPVKLHSSSTHVKETPTPSSTENEPIVPVINPTHKIVETPIVSKPPNRRKTIGGIQLPMNNNVVPDDNKPIASWIDMAKQKQNKLQSTPIKKPNQEEPDKQQPSSIEPVIESKKQVIIPSNVPIVKESTPEDTRSNRKLIFESVTTRGPSSPITSPNTHVIERDSIRALKSGNPNRINNLIQFFDK